MSEQCKYDSQVLDYLYGELAEAERAAFASHLATCSECNQEVVALSMVRKKVAALPKPSLEPAAAARMTAQLMEAAIGSSKTKSVGGGRMVPFPSGRVRRFLAHPATALFTVAAAAMLLVVFGAKDAAVVSDVPVHGRAKVATPSTPTGGSPFLAAVESLPAKKAEAPEGVTMPTPPVSPVVPKNRPVTTGSATFASGAPKPETALGATTERRATTKAAVSVSRDWAVPPPSASTAGGKTDQFSSDDHSPGNRFAQPPPLATAQAAAPPVQPSVDEQKRQDGRGRTEFVAQNEDRQRQRAIDALEGGDIGQTPKTTDSDEQNNVATGVAGPAPAASLEKEASLEQQASNVRSNRKTLQTDTNEEAVLVAQFREQLRLGRCADAREVLQKLEKNFPSAAGEPNRAWQRDCGSRVQLPTQLQPTNQESTTEQKNYQNLSKRRLSLPQKSDRASNYGEPRNAMNKKPAPVPSLQIPANKAPAKATAY